MRMAKRTRADNDQFPNHGKRTSTRRRRVIPAAAGGGGCCYIDRLPDDVMIQILERLNLKNAAKTCILSRRFLGLWKLLTRYKRKLYFEELTANSNKLKKFEKFVNDVMRGHEGPSVDSLTISFCELCDSLENWIEFARTKCVKNLDIRFSFKSPPPDFSLHHGWDKLTSLSLRLVHVRKAELERGLKNGLFNLESLFIESGAFDCTTLDVSSKSLKRLEFKDCSKLCSVDIVFAPNLQFYKRMDCTQELRIKGAAPKLSHVCLYARFIVYHLRRLRNTGVEKLEVCMGECWEYRADNLYPRLGNLKELVLRFLILPRTSFFFVILTRLLPACPQLQKLTLYYRHSHDYKSSHWRKLKALERDQLHVRSPVHECLKVVEFCGWSGRENEIEAANLVKEIAPNLEKITYG